MNQIKKYVFGLITLFMILCMAKPVFAMDKAVNIAGATGITTQITISGTTEALAVIIQLRGSDGTNILKMETVGVVEGSFSKSFTELNLADGTDYKIYVADYEGGAWAKTNVNIPHSLTKTDAKAATCTEAGNSEYYTCSTCGKYFSNVAGTTEIAANSWRIAPLGHNTTKTDAVSPTENATGNSEYYTCTRCGKYFSDAAGTTEIAENSWILAKLEPTPQPQPTPQPPLAHTHTMIKNSAVAATCTSAGNSEYYTCSGCGKYYSDAAGTTEITANSWVISALGHDNQSKIVPATTSKDGYTADVCSRCGEVSNKVTISAIKSVTLKSTSVTYTGKTLKPAVTVKDKKGKTVSSKYYTVSCKNNKNVGKATVTIKFKGNYSGTVKKTFKIVPKATTISKVAAAKKGFKVTWKKQKTQATGYEIQYSTDKNFKKAVKTVIISKNKTTSKSITKLAAKKKYYVRIRTYKLVGKTKYYSSWSKISNVTIKK